MSAIKLSFFILITLFSVACAKSATFISELGNEKSTEDSDGSREVENNGKISNGKDLKNCP